MFEGIINFFKKFSKNEDLEAGSKDTAKGRLHLVLMQDRANVSADFLDMMKQEIIEVIKKYIEVDEKEIDVKLTNKTNEDGSVGAPALYANIPISKIKNENKEKLVKENENKTIKTDKNNGKSDNILNIKEQEEIKESENVKEKQEEIKESENSKENKEEIKNKNNNQNDEKNTKEELELNKKTNNEKKLDKNNETLNKAKVNKNDKNIYKSAKNNTNIKVASNNKKLNK